MRAEKIISLANNIGFKILKIDITDYLINQIEHDCIVEGEQTITIENEMFIFEFNISTEINLKPCIGEEMPEYYIENAYELSNTLFNTDLYMDIDFVYNTEKILKTIY